MYFCCMAYNHMFLKISIILCASLNSSCYFPESMKSYFSSLFADKNVRCFPSCRILNDSKLEHTWFLYS